MQPSAAEVALSLLAVAVLACAGSRDTPRQPAQNSPPPVSTCFEASGSGEDSGLEPPEDLPGPDVRPVARNPGDVRRALVENYPSELSEEGLRGAVLVWIRIRDDGRVDSAEVARSSGHAAFDEAAKEVARVMRFAPALDEEAAPMVVWVQRCIRFTVH